MDDFLKWWPVIISLATLVAGGGAARYALRVVVSRLDSLDKRFENTNTELGRLSTSVAVQSATLAAHTEQDRIQFHNLDDRLARFV